MILNPANDASRLRDYFTDMFMEWFDNDRLEATENARLLLEDLAIQGWTFTKAAGGRD